MKNEKNNMIIYWVNFEYATFCLKNFNQLFDVYFTLKDRLDRCLLVNLLRLGGLQMYSIYVKNLRWKEAVSFGWMFIRPN